MRFTVVTNISVPFDWTTTGGSEEYHTQLCEHLKQRGHSVRSFVPLPVLPPDPVLHNGVLWDDISRIDKRLTGTWIIQRDPSIIRNWPKQPGQSFCFAAHDVDYDVKGWTSLYDQIFADSEIHARYLRFSYNHPHIVSTGVAPQLHRIREVPTVVRDPKRLLWSSSYVRGLEYLLMIFERALERVPDLKLAICYGWESIDQAIRSGESKTLQRLKERIVRKIEELGVQDLGRLSSSVEVWKEFSKSGIWCYPTQWQETACQSAMEAQAFGAIPIYSPYWALSENVLNGIPIHGDPYTDRLVRARFVETLVHFATHPDLQNEIRGPMIKEARSRFQFRYVVDRIESYCMSEAALTA